MTVNSDIPDWLRRYILCWSDRLHLEEWEIVARLELCINDDPANRAAIQVTMNIHHALIKFRADIEETPDWERTVIHELLHIKHEPMDQLVCEVVLSELERPARRIAHEAYRNAMEQFIDKQTWLLWKLAQAIDNPEKVITHENGHREIVP